MGQDIDVSESLLDQLDYSTTRIEQFLKNRMKQLGEVPIKIILLKMVEEQKDYINQLLNSPDITIEQRINGFNEFLPRMRNILNKLPAYEELELVRIKFTTLHNLLIIGYSLQHFSDDSTVELHSQATLLSKMLLGMPRIEFKVENLVKPSKWQLEVRKSYFNAIQITSGIYLTSLNQLYMMQKDHAFIWINELCHHLEIYLQFIEKIDVKHLWQQETNDYESFYYKLWASLLPSSQFFSFHISYALLGDEWPDQINYTKILPTNNLDGFKLMNERVVNGIDKIINDVFMYHKLGVIDKNAHPENFTNFQLIKVLQKFIRLPNLLIRAYSNNISSYNELESIHEAMAHIDEMIKDYSDIVGNKNKLMVSSWAPTMLLLTQAYLLLSTLLAVGTRNYEDYQNNVDRVSFVYEHQGSAQVSILSFIKEMTNLYICLELSEDIDIQEVMESLNLIITNLQSRPQFALAAEVVFTILEQVTIGREHLILKDKLSDLYETYILGYGLMNLKEDFEEYTTYLVNLFKNLQDQPCPIVRREINIMDPFTWLIPNFSKLVEDKFDIVYLPFNRQQDRLFSL